MSAQRPGTYGSSLSIHDASASKRVYELHHICLLHRALPAITDKDMMEHLGKEVGCAVPFARCAVGSLDEFQPSMLGLGGCFPLRHLPRKQKLHVGI